MQGMKYCWCKYLGYNVKCDSIAYDQSMFVLLIDQRFSACVCFFIAIITRSGFYEVDLFRLIKF